MRKSMPMEDIVPIIKEVISAGGLFRLYIKGTSMMPLLRQGMDSVMLGQPNNICKNDIILYIRPNGQYVLHRIIKKKGSKLYICGDNQFQIEKGITDKNVIAKVVSFFRDDDEIKLNDEKYLLYVKSLKFNRLKKRCKKYLSFVIKIKNSFYER